MIVKYNATYFPSFYDGKKVRKFIVPIIPDFHSKSSVSIGPRQTKIEEYLGNFLTEGNSIRKPT